jgi:hypothetical protein
MTSLVWATYIALWVLVLVLFAAVFLLYRYHGQALLDNRESRVNQGPKINSRMEDLQLRDLTGAVWQLGTSISRPQFVFFSSTQCRPCGQMLQTLAAFAEHHKADLDTFMLCRGDNESITAFAQDLPESVTVLPDPKWDTGVRLRVSSTPFALIIDHKGVVRAKGVPDNSSRAFEWFLAQTTQGSEKDDSLAVVPASQRSAFS